MEIQAYLFTSFILIACLSTALACSSTASSSAALVTAWRKCNGTTNNITNNVQNVKFSSNYVYTYSASIPDYSIGPWPGNPGSASDQKSTFKFPLNPTKSSTKTTVPIGHIGQWINGVTVYNALDAQSYNNMGIWNRNAYYWEVGGFDSCYGHPGPTGEYHHHVFPKCLFSNLNSSSHSPIFGYSFDGFPIYGPYAYSSPNDSTSSISRMRTSYRLRSITVRQTLANGTVLSSTQYGPPVNSTYDLGAYVEDYEYVSGYGDLDESNGRWCKTPEYPNGTYAYFTTLNSTGYPEYPFVIGSYYYGVLETANTGMSKVVITEIVSTYFTCSGTHTTYSIHMLYVLFLNAIIHFF